MNNDVFTFLSLEIMSITFDRIVYSVPISICMTLTCWHHSPVHQGRAEPKISLARWTPKGTGTITPFLHKNDLLTSLSLLSFFPPFLSLPFHHTFTTQDTPQKGGLGTHPDKCCASPRHKKGLATLLIYTIVVTGGHRRDFVVLWCAVAYNSSSRQISPWLESSFFGDTRTHRWCIWNVLELGINPLVTSSACAIVICLFGIRGALGFCRMHHFIPYVYIWQT